MNARKITEIYETYDYDKFKRLPENRDVLGDRFNKLVASISEKYVLNPIMVNEKYEVIDGQGRFEACKYLGRPIHYYVVEGADAEDCRRMNRYNKSWTLMEFADSFAKKGIPDYILLIKTSKELGLPLSRIGRLSNKSITISGEKSERFTLGKITFTQEDREMVTFIKKKADDIAEALNHNERKNDAFYSGVKVMVETDGYRHGLMINHCRQLRHRYAQCSGLEGQLKQFEDIYNYKLSSKNKLYFSDYMRNKGYHVRNYSNESKLAQDNIDLSTLNEEV